MPASSSPERIGDFTITAVLGQGGMGCVYRARQERLGREVALKVLNRDLAEREDFSRRFLREARAAAAITHPNVITCYDVGQADGVLYMALELVTGGDAAQLMKKRGGKLAEMDALTIIRDAAAGLMAIEDAGLLHRDIKPSNIFLTPQGVGKLADLGLARHAEDDEQLTMAGAPMGTPAYMAPEQAQAVDDVDIRVDIFALGCTLYCLLTGAPPFLGDNPMATLARLMRDPLPDITAARPDVTVATRDLINQTLVKERDGRIAHAADLFKLCEATRRAHQRTTQRRRADDERSGRQTLVDAGGLTRADATMATVPGQDQNGAATMVTDPAPGRPATPISAKGADASDAVSDTTPTAAATPPSGTATRRSPGCGDLVAVAENRAQQPLPQGIRNLVRRVHVSTDRLQAWINLAPGTTFPSQLLERVLHAAGVVYGLDRGLMAQASRPTRNARRLVVAVGDRPMPDSTGRDINGQELPPSSARIEIVVDDEAMHAWAVFVSGMVCARNEVELAVRKADLRFGFDRETLTRLWDGEPNPSGRALIATGRPMQPGRPAGFHLARSISERSLHEASTDNLTKVTKGQELASWQDALKGRNGMDVYGRDLKRPELPLLSLEDVVGEGVEVRRDRQGCQVLVAGRAGYVQQQLDGRIRVIQAVEIAGDIGSESEPVDTDDVVVVRGSVLPGARISSSNDVVIMGDLQDANIEAGGSLEVHGDINPGDGAVTVGGTISVDGAVRRKVVGGNVKISGTVENCELVATGDISIGRVVGGSTIAGGDVTLDFAGEEFGTTTEIWAGHTEGVRERAQIARMVERRLASEARWLGERVRAVGADLHRQRSKFKLLEASSYRDKTAMSRVETELRRRQGEIEEADTEAAEARERLARQRHLLNDIRYQGDRPDATITIRRVAHRGVVIAVADADPIVLDQDETNYRLSLE